jgi:hypothetical protein
LRANLNAVSATVSFVEPYKMDDTKLKEMLEKLKEI